MEHQALYCEGLGVYHYQVIAPRVARTELQRANLTLLVLCGRLPLRIPTRISFDLTTYEAAQLFGGGN